MIVTRREFLHHASAVPLGAAIVAPKSTDIRIDEVVHGYEDHVYRAPYKFGGRVVDRVTLLNVRCRVTTRNGQTAWGFASMTMGNMWAFPSATMSYDTTLDAMKALASRIARLTSDCREVGHPLDIAHVLEPEWLKAAADLSAERKLTEPIPKLCTLVVGSPFDAALHDAFGKVHRRNVYDTYGPDLVTHDVSRYLGPEFRGARLDRALLSKRRERIPVFHSVGGLDPLETKDVEKPIRDGLPETLPEWIRRDGLVRIKIKLQGDNLSWDVDRTLAIDRIASALRLARARSGQAGQAAADDMAYCLDFNERCPDVQYVLECLRRIRAGSPEGFNRILYVEQPTARDLKANRQNVMHEAAKLRPVVIDESLTDLESLVLAREMGYTGVALKACKGQSQTVLMAAAAQKYKLFLCVQDLTCPGASLVHSVGISAHVPAVAGIEANARQYVPAANEPWRQRFPGIFTFTDGHMRTADIGGPGLGIPDDMVPRVSAKFKVQSSKLKRRTVMIAAILMPVLLAQESRAQNPPEIQQTYSQRCGGCHGDDGRGSEQGPALVGSASVRARSTQSLRTVIRNGIPAAGMPAFNLPEDTIDALATMIASWNAVAAKASVPGNAAAGRQFFVGKGQCVSCHLAQGEGSAIGPDLSDIALTLTVDEIREALVNPDARIAPGYDLVSVHLRNGGTLRGFARSRSSFDLAFQDLKGALHPLSLDDVRSITDEKRSHMAAVKATADELRDVIAYLSRMTGVKPGAIAPLAPTEGPRRWKEGEWPTFNGNVSGNRYSPLTMINKSNVSTLSVKWTFSIPLWTLFHPDTPYYRQNMQYFGLETVPIVADGVMYVTGPNQVFALDPRTGNQIWQYSRPRSTDLVSDASLGTNRGVAVLGDHVFLVTDNAHLVALHRITGRPVWEVVMPDEPQKYGGTMAPLVVKDMVIAGVSGGDWGIRGFLAAYKAATGERVWRHWTIPAKGDPGFETWKGTAVATGGGATWQTGSYDPETDTLYWATGNPWPNSDDRERGGDNLFTDCVLALDPATGKLKWYYQFTPHDVRDWDANEPNVLVNTTYRGQERKLLLHADRNGFFYVFDRTNGQLLLAEKFIRRLTWASGIGADGRPVRIPERDLSCPDHATNWHSTVFSPTTRLYYVMAMEKCIVRSSPGSWKTERPRADPATRFLRALDIETGKIVWEVPQAGPPDGKRDAGVLGTAAGILFYGDASGYFVAVDERDGKTLWRVPLNATIKTSPMTFAVGGQQYIALAVGSNIVCFGLSAR